MSWYYRENRLCSSDGTPVDNHVDYTVYDDKNHMICEVGTEAMALLICAAPELVKSLEEILNLDPENEKHDLAMSIARRDASCLLNVMNQPGELAE